MFLFQVRSHLILNHNCFHEELIIHLIVLGIISNRVVGEGLFEEVAFETVLRRPRKCLQKCILDGVGAGCGGGVGVVWVAGACAESLTSVLSGGKSPGDRAIST